MEKTHRIRKTIGAYAVTALLSGCAGTLIMHPRDGGEVAAGAFNAASKTMEVSVGLKRYSGSYVTNAGTAFSTGVAFSGTRSAYGTSQTFSGGNNGVALLAAADGDTMRCEFNYQGLSAIGVCQTRGGKIYDFMTQ